MEELRRLGTAQQSRELDLAAGGRKQVVAADDERHTLYIVVHRRGELVRPVALAAADQQVAALFRRPLLLRTVTQIDEALQRRLEPNAKTNAGVFTQPAVATRARITNLIRM